MKLQKKLKGQCLENVEELKRAYKVCADNQSMCFIQKMIADQYRYAYEALDIQQYEQEESKTPDSQGDVMTPMEGDAAIQQVKAIPKEPLISDKEFQEI